MAGSRRFWSGRPDPEYCGNADQNDRSHDGNLARPDKVVAQCDLVGPTARRPDPHSNVGQPRPVLDRDGRAVAEELGTDNNVGVGEVIKTECSPQKRRSGITAINSVSKE